MLHWSSTRVIFESLLPHSIRPARLRTWSCSRRPVRVLAVVQAFEDLDPRLFSYNSSQGWCEECLGTGMALNDDNDDSHDEKSADEVCSGCNGKRLNAQALAVEFHGIAIDQMTAWSVGEARVKLSKLKLRRSGTLRGPRYFVPNYRHVSNFSNPLDCPIWRLIAQRQL